MKITVLNGSPKGEVSATMQYVRFIQKKFPQHAFSLHPIGERIRAIEKEERRFDEIVGDVKTSDGVLWVFPLYYFLVSSQYKRFIELLFEREARGAFENKYAAVLTTSIHFFDHTAHNYMNAICDDLGMKYVGSFSADMYDLLKEKERNRLLLFAGDLFDTIDRRTPTARAYLPLSEASLPYEPGAPGGKVDLQGRKLVVLVDSQNPGSNLDKMIGRLRDSFSGPSDLVYLDRVETKGGCLGCLQCGFDNQCVYTGKDEYVDFFNAKVRTADILIFAGAIRDRYLSSRWKLFFDRSFFNTHIPTLTGKQLGYVISGPLGQIPNLRQILEAYAELQQANPAGFVTDECRDSEELDGLIFAFASRAAEFSKRDYVRPRTFLGVGGRKIFRDDIYGKLRFPFRADHKYYEKAGLFDFPQKDYRTRMRSILLTLLAKIPSMRKEIYQRRMKAEMIKPLQKAVEKS